MSNILNAVKDKFHTLKQNGRVRILLISVLALLLIFSVTLAWYINNVTLFGMEFNTGNIDFNVYVYNAEGGHEVGPVASNEELQSDHLNTALISLQNASVGSISTAYIVVESIGSIGIQYRLAFDIMGRTENSLAYLGGYKYNVSDVTDKVRFSGSGDMDVSDCGFPEEINDEVVTIDRNAINGKLEEKNQYHVYRVDFTLVEDNEEYTGNEIQIYFNIFATQIDGSFEDDTERGTIYNCSTREDIDHAKVEAYPGDIIKLCADIVYYGDLVFNKPVTLETNDYTLTVNGNLMYDYVLSNSLKIDAGGLGKIVVQCTKEGVGGNFQIKAPIGDVKIIGSNASTGDIVVEKNVLIDATNAFGSAGVSFTEVKIVDLRNSKKTIQLESNTRATVSFDTTIGLFQAVAGANVIEIVNNGVIGEINLSNMSRLNEQPSSPQIYVLNNNDISNPIILPSWSVKFVEDASGKCTGNTRIIQSYSGNTVTVIGGGNFTNDDVEVERKDFLVEQIIDGDDSRLKIYYQDVDGQTTTIQSILEEYLKYESTTGCTVSEIVQLEIICIGTKILTNEDIAFMNSNSMLSLKQLDLQRANVYDQKDGVANKLSKGAFQNVSKYESLSLPRNLVAIGDNTFLNSKIDNIITIPSGVTEFGSDWFKDGKYVCFAASVPVAQASAGLTNVQAVFVDEAYIGSYRTVYSTYATRIYPISELDETKSHFVRNTKNDEWEITYFIGGEEVIIGENVTMSGVKLKITSIYDNAFRHNYSGAKVRFADSVEKLGSGNFTGNKNITEVNLNKIKSVGDEAFSNASSISYVAFGSALESIGDKAFLSCVALMQDIQLPSTMQRIGISAFQKATITGVNTGGTTVVGSYAFANCPNLIYAELPSVEIVGENENNSLFDTCGSLVSAKLPALKQAGGTRMFVSCSSLREVYFATPEDGLYLGTHAFTFCNTAKLKLYVPEENLAFFQGKKPGDIKAEMIYPEGEKMGEELVNGFNIGTYIVRNNGDQTYTIITSNIDYSGNFTIPEDYNGKVITGIYANAFRNQNFSNVTLILGDNIQTIGSYAFYKLNGLAKVEIGNSLVSVDGYAFRDCANLIQELDLPETMETIGQYAFSGTGITRVNTGGTTSVDDYAFGYCASLSYAELPEVTTVAESGSNRVFRGCTLLVTVKMPKVTKVYGAGMFQSCTSLMELYMAHDTADVTLGSQPFAGVTSSQIKLFVPAELLSLYKDRGIISSTQVFPEGEKLGEKTVNGIYIGDYTVIENSDGYTLVTTHLTFTGEVEVPDEYNNKPVTAIYENAFRNQTFTDANLILGDNIKVIGDYAFYGVSGLKSVAMDQVTQIGKQAFYNSSIQVLNAPKVTNIGTEAFRRCSGLEMVSVPKVETLESTYVFGDCSNLKYVYFENVMSLSYHTFYEDKKLEKITINRLIDSDKSNMPSTMTINADAPCKIYVPYRSLSAYPSVWSGKPVVTFDVSAVYNGDTYILANRNGRYALIDFAPAGMSTSLTMPATISADEVGNVAIYAIENGAFASVAETLKNLTISSTIVQLDSTALSECAVLENVYVDSNNRYFTSVNGVLYSKDGGMLVKYPAGRSGLFNMTDGAYASTVGVASGAFANAKKLTQIVFPASLRVIDSKAFTNCSGLNYVEFTGTTPPSLMGAGIFDTSVDDFKMVIPSSNADVIAAYMSAYNFVEYEPYIDLNGTVSTSSTGRFEGVSAVRGQQIAASALSYVGCSYLYGGTTPDGFDCSGFVQYVYKQNGISINRTATSQLSDGYNVSYEEMQPGDLIYFGSDGTVTHVGLYVGDGNFVHAQNSETGVVVTNLSESYYANRFMYALRVVG